MFILLISCCKFGFFVILGVNRVLGFMNSHLTMALTALFCSSTSVSCLRLCVFFVVNCGEIGDLGYGF